MAKVRMEPEEWRAARVLQRAHGMLNTRLEETNTQSDSDEQNLQLGAYPERQVLVGSRGQILGEQT